MVKLSGTTERVPMVIIDSDLHEWLFRRYGYVITHATRGGTLSTYNVRTEVSVRYIYLHYGIYDWVW